MTILSTLTDTVLVTSLDDNDKKSKLAIVAMALVGILLLLRWKMGDSEEDEDSEEEIESESKEGEDEEGEDNEGESEDDKSKVISESAEENLAEVQRELDVFDMLAILASAIKAAREEYDQRAES